MTGQTSGKATAIDVSAVESPEPLLLPAALDRLAAIDGGFPYAKYLDSRSYDDGFKVLTILQLATAVDNVARILQEQARIKPDSRVIAYLGPNSPYTTVAFIAAIKAGWEIFLPSERNTVHAQLHLLAELDCRTILTPDCTFAPVKAIHDARSDLDVLELPSLSAVCTGSTGRSPFAKSIDSCGNETCFIVHTSGSTGFPKPVRISFEAVMRMARCLTLPEVEGHRTLYSMLRGKVCVDLLPLNHPAGINIGILNAIYNKFSVVLPPPGLPPTAKVLAEMADMVNADWAAMAPLTMEELSKDPESTRTVTDKLSMLLYSGGSLPKVFGDTISPKVRLLSGMGSSETGPMATMYPNDFDWANEWEHLKFHPSIGTFLDPLHDGTFELTQQRTSSSERYQMAFTKPDSGHEFRSKDLFMPHPHKDGLWKHVSRLDDVIVLLNGEKVNPVQCESIVATHPKVAGALMFGAQRFETGLLLELVDGSNFSPAERSRILDEVWVKVEEANSLLPGHGKLDKEHILFTYPGEPILRTLKNTVKRKPTLDLYRTRIDKLYQDVEEMWAPKQSLQELPLRIVRQVIEDAVRAELCNAQFVDDGDFFQAGMDSLQVLRLVRRIKGAIAIDGINPSLIYRSSTIASLTNAVFELSRGRDAEMKMIAKDKSERLQSTRARLLAQGLEPFNAIVKSNNKPGTTERQTVVLTGSTGYIGCYLLRALIEISSIAHVYCLNRSEESASSQSGRNTALDPALPSSFDSSRVTLLKADLTEPEMLGLAADVYQKISSEASIVIHCAWPVDFNKPLAFFERSLFGLINLIRFCNASSQGARLMFISSVSAAMNTEGSIPEAFIDDTSSCADAGYAESKWIGEAVCKHAAEKFQVPCTVVRLGQIAGALNSTGGWNPADWLPALVMSSAYLGALPDRLPEGSGTENTIRWMPVDVIADVLVDLLLTHDDNDAFEVCQPLNPEATSWHSLLADVASSISDHPNGPYRDKDIEIVTSSEWLRRLRGSASDASEDLEELIRVNPALKLHEFFELQYAAGQEGTAETRSGVWETSRAQRSQHLRQARAISGEDMYRWTGQWLEQLRRA